MLRRSPSPRAGALYQYARATQMQSLAHITGLVVEHEGAYLRLDAATRRNLEISETLRGQPAPTLLSLLDTCSTSMGSRWLRHCLHHPLADRDEGIQRHDAVAELIGEAGDGPYAAPSSRIARASATSSASPRASR